MVPFISDRLLIVLQMQRLQEQLIRADPACHWGVLPLTEIMVGTATAPSQRPADNHLTIHSHQ
jgi:hypothetical protein